MTLIPSLYTFVDKSWLTYSTIIVFDPSSNQIDVEDTKAFGSDLVIQPVLKIKQSTLDRLIAFGTEEDLKIVFVHSARPIMPEYERVMTDMHMAHHKVITLEQELKDLQYRYSSVLHDNKLLQSTTSTVTESEDKTDEQTNRCEKCKNIKSLRECLKELKKESHEQISKSFYEIETSRKTILDLQTEIAKLKEDNIMLKEVNRSLYMNR